MQPFKFAPNRIARLYSGGSGIDRLRGVANPTDSRFPEDWIASCVEAARRVDTPEGHGISRLEYGDRAWTFPEFLRTHAEAVLGPRHRVRHGDHPALLTKLLDSAEQLPLQAHPTRADAQRHFGVPYGKTEAWIVLATRTVAGREPYLLAGFNETLDRETFVRESVAGEYRDGLGMLHRIPVKAGDVITIPGGLPHAIGPGVTMVEIMEPSDLVVVPERNCCGVMLDERKRFAGLGAATAMTLFDYTKRTRAELLADIMPRPETLAETAGGTLERLIPAEAVNGCFEAYAVTLRGRFAPAFPRQTFRIGVVTEGTVAIGGHALRAGDGFLVPYAVDDDTFEGAGRIVFALPPE